MYVTLIIQLYKDLHVAFVFLNAVIIALGFPCNNNNKLKILNN